MRVKKKNQARLAAVAAGVALAMAAEGGESRAEVGAASGVTTVERTLPEGAPVSESSSAAESATAEHATEPVAAEPTAVGSAEVEQGPTVVDLGAEMPTGTAPVTGEGAPDVPSFEPPASEALDLPSFSTSDRVAAERLPSLGRDRNGWGASDEVSILPVPGSQIPVVAPEGPAADAPGAVSPLPAAGIVPGVQKPVVERVSSVALALFGPFLAVPGEGGMPQEGASLSALLALWWAGRSRVYIGNHAPVAGSPTSVYVPTAGVATGELNFSDADGDALTYRVISTPQHGVVTVNPDGSYTYVAGADIRRSGGTDTFIVEASDANYPHVHGRLIDLILGRSGQHVASQMVTVAVSPSFVDSIEVGKGPARVAVSHDGSRAFVSNNLSGTVSVIDTTTGKVVSTLDFGGGPYSVGSVVLSPDGSKAYVFASWQIAVVDTSTGQVVDMIPTSTFASVSAVISPDGTKMYAVSNDSRGKGVAVVDLSDGTLLDFYEVGSGQSNIAIAPDGRHLYIADQFRSAVFVIDAESGDLVRAIDVDDPRPAAVVVSPDGTTLYVGNVSGKSLSVIDTSSWTVVDTIATGVSPSDGAIAISPDGNYVYMADSFTGRLVVIDTDSREVVGDLEIEGFVTAIATSSDGSRLYLSVAESRDWSNQGPGRLVVLDTAQFGVSAAPINTTV